MFIKCMHYVCLKWKFITLYVISKRFIFEMKWMQWRMMLMGALFGDLSYATRLHKNTHNFFLACLLKKNDIWFKDSLWCIQKYIFWYLSRHFNNTWKEICFYRKILYKKTTLPLKRSKKIYNEWNFCVKFNIYR